MGKLTGIDFLNPQYILDFVQGTELQHQKPVIVPLKRGSCTFHHGQTFHFAHPNRTDRPRRVLAIIYMPDRTTYSGQPHICTDGLNLQVSKPIQGGLFPSWLNEVTDGEERICRVKQRSEGSFKII